MAIYKLQPSVNRVAGSRGGVTFQKAGTSFIIRTKAIIIQKRTALQSIQQNRFASVCQNWRSLSELDQATWLNQVPNYPKTDSLGNQFFLQKNVLQNASNNNAAINKAPFISIASSPVTYPIRTIDNIEYNDQQQTLEILITPIDTPAITTIPIGFSCKVYWTGAITQTTQPPTPDKFKLVSVLDEGTDTQNLNFLPEYLQTYPPLLVDKGLFVFAAARLTSLTNFVDDDQFFSLAEFLVS